MLPKDPHMLASFLNLKLRDFYPSLDALCEDLDADKEEILQKLRQKNMNMTRSEINLYKNMMKTASQAAVNAMLV